MEVIKNKDNYVILKQDNDDKILISHITPVVKLHKGEYYLLNGCYNAATQKHISKFTKKKITKSYLLSLKVGDII